MLNEMVVRQQVLPSGVRCWIRGSSSAKANTVPFWQPVSKFAEMIGRGWSYQLHNQFLQEKKSAGMQIKSRERPEASEHPGVHNIINNPRVD